LREVFQNREAARETGKRARAKVAAGWTWKHAAAKALTRIQALTKAPALRYQIQADAAVLIDGILVEDLDSLIESLQRHTYASIAAFVRCAVPVEVRGRYPQIEFLGDRDFNSTIQYLRTRVRTSYLAVVTDPIRFSKHWLSQLAGVAQTTGEAAAVIVPAMAEQSSEMEDAEFQKLARTRWRERRGLYHPFEGDFSGCALVGWSCLDPELAVEAVDGRDWLEHLRRRGIPVYTAEDTCIGPAFAERFMHTP